MTSLSAPELFLLSFATLFTSGFAAVLGQGGGIMLFALLSIYFDLPLLIALHGVVQIFSNSSRAALALPNIKWRIINPILLGTLLGAIAISLILPRSNWQWMQSVIGAYILLVTWRGGISIRSNIPGMLFISGLFQGALGLLLGATGPLTSALLFSKGLAKDSIVASNAVIMTTSHIIKVILLYTLGVGLWQHVNALVTLSLAAVIGSFIGTHIRHKIAAERFAFLFKWLLTILALRLLLSGMSFL